MGGQEVTVNIYEIRRVLLLAAICSRTKGDAICTDGVIDVLENKANEFITNAFAAYDSGSGRPVDLEQFLIDSLPENSFCVLAQGLNILREEFNPVGRGITPDAIRRFKENTNEGLILPEDKDARMADSVARGILKYKREFERTEGFTRS